MLPRSQARVGLAPARHMSAFVGLQPDKMSGWRQPRPEHGATERASPHRPR